MPWKVSSLEMINETSVSCEVRAGVFFTPAAASQFRLPPSLISQNSFTLPYFDLIVQTGASA